MSAPAGWIQLGELGAMFRMFFRGDRPWITGAWIQFSRSLHYDHSFMKTR